MELFKLLGTIAISGAETAKKEIDSVSGQAGKLGKTLSDLGGKISDFGGKLTTRLSVPLAALGTLSVKSAADVKAANSQFEQTFGNLQDTATKAINNVANASGILDTRLRGVGTSIYAFAKSSGADSAEAMALMEEALQATADAAAYYDRSLDDTSESLMSFLKGNYANDAALGVSCTETTRNAKAMELFGEKFNDLTEIQKQQTLLKMVTDSQKLSGAMGQASRESDGFENVMGNLKESAKLLSAEFGEVLLPTVIDLVQKFTGLLQNFNSMDDSTKKLILTIGGLAIATGPILTVIGKVTSGIGAIISVGGSLIGGIGKLTPVVTGLIGTGGELLKGIVSVGGKVTGVLIPAITSINPIVIAITAAVAALIAIGVALYKNWDKVSESASKAWGAISDTVGNTVEAISGFLSDCVSSIGTFKENFVNGLSDLKDGMSEKLKLLKEGIISFKDDFVKGLSDLKDGAVEKFQSLKESASQKVSELKESIVTNAEELKEKATSAFTGIADKAVEGFNNLKEKGSTAIENLSSSFTTTFGNMWDSVVEKASEFAGKFAGPIEAARDKVTEIVGNIKGLFNFDWKLPDIKLPHFDISYDSSGVLGGLASKIGLPGLPKLSVEWYKDGGILTDPTAFGFNPYSGKVMAGGEAGPEAIAPISTLQSYVQEAVSESNYQMYQVMNQMLSLMTQYFPQMANTQLVLDTGTLVGELAEPMNEELGKITYMRGRWN